MKIPAPGRMVDIGGRALHVHSSGRGEPVVVLEAGIAASSVSWSLVQDRVARMTTVLSYDRAGFGWSIAQRGAAGEQSGTARDAAADLAAMLARSGFRGPYVLAAHSYGGLIARIYQQQFPERVAGLVLVDPVARREWREMPEFRRRMLARGAMLSRRGALLARLGVVRMALWMLTSGSRRIPQLLARVSAGEGASMTARLVGEVSKMPREHWPAIAAHWSEARSFDAMAENLEQLPVSVTQIDEASGLGDLPVVVLSAADSTSDASAEHAAEAKLSTRGEHLVLKDAGHWIQLDAPDVVADSIGRVIALVRGQ
jgi:pimeloyl-ACP methyl ester carboxylesterase